MAAVMKADKQDLRSRVDRELAAFAKASPWSLKQKLALACRMLAARGHWEGGLQGQISARGEEPGTYWTLRFAEGADEAQASRLLKIDGDLNCLNEDSIPNPATRFHVWVYRERPDVQCIVHTHPPAVSALSMVGEPLAIAHMDATPFHDDVAFLDRWPGLPIGDQEGEIIAGTLKDKRAILLAHHGLLTAGRSIEEAAVMAIWMEQAAERQLRARAIGPVRPVPDELAKEAHDFLVKPEIMALTFGYFARDTLRRWPECIE